MHIVIIVGSYYPNYSAVGNCAKNFSEALERMGHSVTIVSQRTSLKEKKHVEKPQSIYRIDSFLERCVVRGKETGKLSKYISFLGRSIRFILSILQRQNVKWDVVKAYIKELRIINHYNQIDIIVPFCFPFEGILSATKFKASINSEIKIIPFLFDRFAASDALHRTKWNRNMKMSTHIALERNVFEMCNNILTMPSWLHHVHISYPELEYKFIQVEHPLLIPINSNKNVEYDNSKLNIVFTGSLIKAIHTPSNSFKSIIYAIKSMPKIRVHLYARGNCEEDIQIFQRQCPEQVIYHGSVDIETAHAAMKAADVLLSIGNSNIIQMASKNFEYVATGSPVIHFYYDKEDPANLLLNKMGNCLLLSQHDSPEYNGKSIIEFLSSKPIKHTFEEVAELIPEALPETSAKLFISKCNN